ncbi:MAG: hypothetical protein AAF337_09790, partial [Pseudomonadota bacterium]
MTPLRKLAFATVLTAGLSVGAVVSLGGGTLFQTGGDGGWFGPIFGSETVVRASNPRADTRLADQSDDTSEARTILNPRVGEEDLSSAAARMASLPYVTAQDALRGAVTGDAPGMATLQAFLDRAGFDPEALQQRSFALFDDLEDGRGKAFTQDETLQAARRIASAAQLTAQSAFVFPAVMFPGFDTGEDHAAWDVGPVQSAPYSAFGQIEDSSKNLFGDALRFFNRSGTNALLADGAESYDQLRVSNPALLASNVNGDGPLRLYAIAAKNNAEGDAYPLPFGYGLSTNDLSYRLVDARQATGSPWVSLAETRLALHGGEWVTDSASEPSDTASAGEETGTVLSQIPLSVRGYQDLTLVNAQGAFRDGAASVLSVPVPQDDTGISLVVTQLSGVQTTISGFVLGPDPMPAALAVIAARAATFEENRPIVAARNAASRPPSAAPQTQARRSLGFLPVQIVDYPEALTGALAGTRAGTRTMAAYLDGAGGDLPRLEARAMALIEGLAARSEVNDFLTLADAANRITEATAQAAATTYLMNGRINADFDLPDTQAGWDFGDPADLPYSGMTRAGGQAPVIIGQSAASGRTPSATPLVGDYLSRVEGLRFALPATYYRVLMLVSPQASTGQGSPLGNSVVVNGAPTRLRDLRPAQPASWSRLEGGAITMLGGLDVYGPVDPRLEDMLQVPDDLPPLRRLMMQGGVYTDLPPTGQNVQSSAMLASGEGNAFVYAGRAYVGETGALLMDFAAPPQGGTVIGAAILGESDPEPMAERLAERIAQLLGSTAPAAGFLPGDIQPAAGTLFAAAFNAPQQVAANLNAQTRSSGGPGSLGPTGGGGFGGAAVADGGGTDGGGADGGGADGGGADGGGADGGGADGGGADGGGADGGGADGGGADGGGADGGGADGGGADGGGADGGGADGGGADGGGADGGGADGGGADGGGADGGGADGGGADGGGADGGGADGGGADGGGADGGGADGGGVDGGGADGGGADGGGADGGGADGGG